MYKNERITQGNIEKQVGKFTLRERLFRFIEPATNRLKIEDLPKDLLATYREAVRIIAQEYGDEALEDWLLRIPIYITKPDSYFANEDPEALAHADPERNTVDIDANTFDGISTLGLIKTISHELVHLIGVKRFRDGGTERVGASLRERNQKGRRDGFVWLEEAEAEQMAMKVYYSLDKSKIPESEQRVYFSYRTQVRLYEYLIEIIKLKTPFSYQQIRKKMATSRITGDYRWFYRALDKIFGPGSSRNIFFNIPHERHFNVEVLIKELDFKLDENTRN